MSEPTARVPSIEAQIVELEEAGWRQETRFVWRAPDGTFHVGPHGAWKKMKRWNAAIPTEAAQHSEGPATIGEHDDCASVYVLKSKHLSRRTRFDCHSKADAIWLRDALNERAALSHKVELLEWADNVRGKQLLEFSDAVNVNADIITEKDKRIAELESIREKYLMLCAVHSTPSDFCIQTACRVGDDALTFLMEWEERIKKPFLEKIARLTAELTEANRKLELMPALVDGCRLAAIDRAREESAQGAEAQKPK